MDLSAVITFLITYYLRPQDWIGLIYDFPLVQYIMLFALVSMLAKHRRMQFGDFFKTPHDWLLMAYAVWVVWTAEQNRGQAFADLRNMTLFYVVIVQALSDRERLRKYITVWTWSIFAVTVLALDGEYAFDLTGSYDITHSVWMKGRLCMNTFNYNNPNSLAHYVLPVLPMLYFLYVWHRPIFIKEWLMFLQLIPGWCIYLTQSRGGYMAGVVGMGTAMLFGKPKLVQALAVVVLLGVGVPGLRAVRHMERADDKGSEASVEGRKMAFQFGLRTMNTKTFKGLGYRRFTQFSPWKIEIKKGKKVKTRRIAAHSSYVGIGAEQGKMGLFLWLGVFYCSLKTLLLSVCKNEEDERLRRLLLSVVLMYLLSSWFNDLEYAGVFFIINAVAAAFHRVVRLDPAAQLAAPSPVLAAPNVTPAADAPTPRRPHRVWNRIGLLDIPFMFLFMLIVIRIWRYLASSM